ncbi:hypothetical protein HDV63DRAFT_297683 [Trichoderma sp. SZMC 28014]
MCIILAWEFKIVLFPVFLQTRRAVTVCCHRCGLPQQGLAAPELHNDIAVPPYCFRVFSRLALIQIVFVTNYVSYFFLYYHYFFFPVFHLEIV